MKEHRREQIARQLQRQLGAFLQSSWSGRPQDTLCSITEIDLSPDFHYATARLSIYPAEQEEQLLESVTKDIKTIQAYINKTLRSRPVPRITFIIDPGQQQRSEIEDILNEGN